MAYFTWNWKVAYRSHSPCSQGSSSGSGYNRSRRASGSFSQPSSKKARNEAPAARNDGEGNDGEDEGNWIPLDDEIIHPHSEGYKCPLSHKLPHICSLEFNTENEAIDHAFAEHPYCAACKLSWIEATGDTIGVAVIKDILFANLDGLKKHALYNHVKVVPCPYTGCGEKFGFSYKLALHVERTHWPRDKATMEDKALLKELRRQDWRSGRAILHLNQPALLQLYLDVCKSSTMETLNKLIIDSLRHTEAAFNHIEDPAQGPPINNFRGQDFERDDSNDMNPNDMLSEYQNFDLEEAILRFSLSYVSASPEERQIAFRNNASFVWELYLAITENLDVIQPATIDGYHASRAIIQGSSQDSQQNRVEYLLPFSERYPLRQTAAFGNPVSELPHGLQRCRSLPTLRNASFEIPSVDQQSSCNNDSNNDSNSDSTSEASHQPQNTGSASVSGESCIQTVLSSGNVNFNSQPVNITKLVHTAKSVPQKSPGNRDSIMLDRYINNHNPRDEPFPLYARIAMGQCQALIGEDK
ncbi:hypothetical protein K440DRAFT_661522 [Wilcoxina mikolae CBS 423.85]|nr:hypothetical protein K440DRAFT_661522 [Wilcoxina mikolae CBS 423.85]